MRTALAVLALLLSAGCGSGAPSSPAPPPPASGPVAGTLVLSGTVWGTDATGRRPLAGATVDLGETSGAWGSFGRPLTNANGRYVFGSLSAKHYQAKATMAGYDESPVESIGFMEASRTLDFELVRTGLITGQMTLTAVEPSAGSTVGGTPVTITGSGFRSGSTVTFDSESIPAYALNTTTLFATTPAHAAGPVTVVVTNPAGERATLTAGYSYAPPQSFNFNGGWTGYALAHPFLDGGAIRSQTHSDMEMQFTVENNQVTAFSCGGAVITLAAPLAVSGGGFSFTDTGVTLTGRIVSAATTIGTIDTPACPQTRWEAYRQQ